MDALLHTASEPNPCQQGKRGTEGRQNLLDYKASTLLHGAIPPRVTFQPHIVTCSVPTARGFPPDKMHHCPSDIQASRPLQGETGIYFLTFSLPVRSLQLADMSITTTMSITIIITTIIPHNCILTDMQVTGERSWCSFIAVLLDKSCQDYFHFFWASDTT